MINKLLESIHLAKFEYAAAKETLTATEEQKQEIADYYYSMLENGKELAPFKGVKVIRNGDIIETFLGVSQEVPAAMAALDKSNNPLIIVNDKFTTDFSAEEQEAVLAHEHTHVKGIDSAYEKLEASPAFNPYPTWKMRRKMIKLIGKFIG